MIGKPGRMLARPGMVGVDFTELDDDYLALLAEAIDLEYALPSPRQQLAGSSLIAALKAAGVWSKLDILYVYAGAGSQEFATLNWKAPASFQCLMVNSPIWENAFGFGSDGATSYLDTQWIQNTNGVNYTLNSASISAYMTNTSAVGNRIICGPSSTSSSGRITLAFGSTSAIRINSTLALSPAVASNKITGLHVANRTNSTTVVYSDNRGATTHAQTSNARLTVNSLVMRGGTNYMLEGWRIAEFACGADLVSEDPAYRAAMDAYMESL